MPSKPVKPQNRDVAGRFPKGVSGNAGGRPKGYGEYIRERCGHDGKLLADILIAIVTNDVEFMGQHGYEVPNTKELLTAIEMLSNRGYGSPPKDINITGNLNTTQKVIHEHGK